MTAPGLADKLRELADEMRDSAYTGPSRALALAAARLALDEAARKCDSEGRRMRSTSAECCADNDWREGDHFSAMADRCYALAGTIRSLAATLTP